MRKNLIFILFIVWIFLIVNPLYAYLDPGTGSMILQVVLGSIAAGLVTIKVYWKKITEFFKKDKDKDSQADSTDQKDS